MGIEFELKYRATAEGQCGIRAGWDGPWESISMETTYYDTPAGALSELRYTLRRRLENGRSICTVKTPAGCLGRGEWETEADSIEGAIHELCKLGAPQELLAMTAGGVIPICGARFTRRACRIRQAGLEVELALDRGMLLAGDRETPLCEVEVELKSGSREAAMAFAEALAQKYALQPEPKSKFRRALELRKER